MSSDPILDRLRQADPAPPPAMIIDQALFTRIVAAPGDPRLSAPAPRRRRRWPSVLIASAVLLGAGSAAGAITLGGLTRASPRVLLEADPQGRYARFPGQITRGTGQTVIPQSVHLAASFTVPGFGRFEWWIARSRPSGWVCGALRQPDGTWADLGAPHDRYQLGGPAPGCGTLPWRDAQGFAYWPSSIRSPDGQEWRVAWGYVPSIGHPVEVRDEVSGATAPIGNGRYFAIVMPASRSGYRLQTLNASGRVLVSDQLDPGH